MADDLFELLRAGHEVRITRCERHKDWMRDITADCPDPCPDCVYEPIPPATSEEIAAANELTALTQEMGLYRPATSEETET